LLRNMKLRSLHVQNYIGMPGNRILEVDQVHLPDTDSLLDVQSTLNGEAIVLDESLKRVNQILPFHQV
ncbi:hypothetical protein PFISCL1PPCAC_21317, partial [Pristionchus fissidentatus]